jgi:hypothetical protein
LKIQQPKFKIDLFWTAMAPIIVLLPDQKFFRFSESDNRIGFFKESDLLQTSTVKISSCQMAYAVKEKLDILGMIHMALIADLYPVVTH